MRITVYTPKRTLHYGLVEQINEDPEGIWIQYIDMTDQMSKYEKLPDDTERIMIHYEA